MLGPCIFSHTYLLLFTLYFSLLFFFCLPSVFFLYLSRSFRSLWLSHTPNTAYSQYCNIINTLLSLAHFYSHRRCVSVASFCRSRCRVSWRCSMISAWYVTRRQRHFSSGIVPMILWHVLKSSSWNELTPPHYLLSLYAETRCGMSDEQLPIRRAHQSLLRQKVTAP